MIVATCATGVVTTGVLLPGVEVPMNIGVAAGAMPVFSVMALFALAGLDELLVPLAVPAGVAVDAVAAVSALALTPVVTWLQAPSSSVSAIVPSAPSVDIRP